MNIANNKLTFRKPSIFWQCFLWSALIMGAVLLVNYIPSANKFSTIKVGEVITVSTSTPITKSISSYGTMLMFLDSRDTPLIVDMRLYGSLFYIEKGVKLKALLVKEIPDDKKRLFFHSVSAKEIKNMVKIIVLDGENEGKEGWVSDLQFFWAR